MVLVCLNALVDDIEQSRFGISTVKLGLSQRDRQLDELGNQIGIHCFTPFVVLLMAAPSLEAARCRACASRLEAARCRACASRLEAARCRACASRRACTRSRSCSASMALIRSVRFFESC